MKSTKSAVAGQTPLEALIAATIFVVILSTIVLIFYGGQASNLDTLEAQRALHLSRTGLEAARTIRDGDWDELSNGSHGLIFATSSWTFSGTSDTKDIYTRTVVVSDAGLNVRKLISRITWQATFLRTQTLELAEHLTNWAGVVGGRSDPSGDWTNPRTLSNVDAGAALEGTDVDAEGIYAYLSTESANANKKDLHIFNVSDPANPTLSSATDINDAKGIVSLDRGTGNYLFVALNGITNDLAVINVSNTASPSISAQLNVNGTDALSIFEAGGKVYFGTKSNSSGAEFYVINVADPLNPAILGSYEVGAAVNDIFIQNNRAYLATSKTDSGLMILDVTNSASPSLLGSTFSSTAKSIYVKSLAVTLVGVGNDLKIVDVTSPGAITTVGTYDAGDTVNDIDATGTLAFLGTSNSNKEFQVINISNPAAPSLHSSFNFPQNNTGIDYYNNLVFASVRSNDALRIITSSP